MGGQTAVSGPILHIYVFWVVGYRFVNCLVGSLVWVKSLDLVFDLGGRMGGWVGCGRDVFAGGLGAYVT